MNDELLNKMFLRTCMHLGEWYEPNMLHIVDEQRRKCIQDAEKGDERAIKFFVRYTAELLKG